VTPGSLHIVIADRSIEVELIGGATWLLPVGPLTLVENELERAVQPAPAQLTNALGIVSDHLDDVVRESPMVLGAVTVTISGPHALVLACVELGADSVPEGYTLARTDADEVFRTLVAEPVSERLHNPGLQPDHVESIIGTCCVVLAVMRRLELSLVAVEPQES
jgi:exopolyphosphatase/pppGpp-phosphohydrolase